jgi:heterotetrameric sarcosine oxidase gamma subunit
MKGPELLVVTRLPALRVSLLQIHGTTVQTAEQLATRVLGNLGEHRSPTAGPRVYSIGPMEWLLIEHPIFEMRRRLKEGVARVLIRLTDVSDAFTSFDIRGAHTRSVLASDIGAPPVVSASRPGNYARTRLGQIEVILHCTGENAFEVHIDRSLADYFESWLAAQHSARFPVSALPH